MRFKSIVELSLGALFLTSMYLSGVGGCGGASSATRAASAVDLTTTVSLPASTTSSLNLGSVSGLGIKRATAETVQPGLTVQWYNEDTLLGTCITSALGDCTLATALADGEYNIFMRVLDSSGNVKAGSILNSTISASTTTVTKPVNSAEDLAYQSYLASCEKKLGAPCVPGTNMTAGVAQVVPGCIRDAIVDMAGADVSNDTVGGQFGALLEAHRGNIAGGGTVDMKEVMRGDSSAQSTFGTSFGDVTALTTKSVASADAARTASSILDNVVDTLCDDSTTFATIKADADYAADPGVFANMFGAVAPGQVASLTPATMKNMFVNSAGVGNGLEYFGNPLGAQAMMETFFNGGFDDITDAAEFKKRGAVVFGAGFPADRTEAERMGKAAFNIMGGDNFADATLDHALNNFGPLLGDDDQMLNFIDGGSQAFDNMIDRFGSLDVFAIGYETVGNVDDFLSIHPQGGAGAACTSPFDCLPPLNCSAGACAGATGIGNSCTANSDCDTVNGVACDPTGRCVYALGQAGTVDFGSDFTLPTAGATGGDCSTAADCLASDVVCLQGRCESLGSGAGSEICGDGLCNGSESPTNCLTDCGANTSNSFCGDSTCDSANGETITTCPGDCSGGDGFSGTYAFSLTGGICTILSSTTLTGTGNGPFSGFYAGSGTVAITVSGSTCSASISPGGPCGTCTFSGSGTAGTVFSLNCGAGNCQFSMTKQ